MKRMLYVVCLVGILTSAIVLGASASETNWTILIRSGSGGTYTSVQNSGNEAWAGTNTLATTVDDPTIDDASDGNVPPAPQQGSVFTAWYRPSWNPPTTAAFPWAYNRDIRTPLRAGQYVKEWADLLIWASDGYTAPDIVVFVRANGGVPNVIQGHQVAYKLVMTYAPVGYAGQTEWLLPPAPDATATTPWFSITLPALGGGKTNPVDGIGPFAAVQTSGYRFTLVTPEPGSLLALGAGLSGFLGLAYRRRK